MLHSCYEHDMMINTKDRPVSAPSRRSPRSGWCLSHDRGGQGWQTADTRINRVDQEPIPESASYRSNYNMVRLYNCGVTQGSSRVKNKTMRQAPHLARLTVYITTTGPLSPKALLTNLPLQLGRAKASREYLGHLQGKITGSGSTMPVLARRGLLYKGTRNSIENTS